MIKECTCKHFVPSIDAYMIHGYYIYINKTMNKIECFIAGYAFCLLIIYLWQQKR